MLEIDPGHLYVLDCIDPIYEHQIVMQFPKRIGENYPGNTPPAYGGPISQEYLRGLIARNKFLDKQQPAPENKVILLSLRLALYMFEVRAKRIRGESLSFTQNDIVGIEDIPTCRECGHIECTKHV